MTAAAITSPPGPGADHKHLSWCVMDVLPEGHGWHCASDYIEVDLSLGKPITYEDGETVPDKISVSLEQCPGDLCPRLWLAHGDVVGDDRLDAAEITTAEALALAAALLELLARGGATFTIDQLAAMGTDVLRIAPNAEHASQPAQ